MGERRFWVCLLAAFCMGTLWAPWARAGAEVVVPFGKYADMGDFGPEGLAVVVDHDGKWGLVDTTGREVVPCKYDGIFGFHDGLAVVRIRTEDEQVREGLIDTTGREIVPPRNYQDISLDFSNGLARVEDPKRGIGYINKNGREVISCQFGSAYDSDGYFDDGIALVLDLQAQANVFIDTQGKRLLADRWNVYSFTGDYAEGMAVIEVDRTYYAFVDVKAKRHFNFTGSSEDIPRLLLGEVSRYYSAYRDDGYSEGLAAVSDLHGKWGYIDKDDHTAIPFVYQNATSFKDGVAAVQDDQGRWGVIDKEGKTVLPFRACEAIEVIDRGLFMMTLRPEGYYTKICRLVDAQGRTFPGEDTGCFLDDLSWEASRVNFEDFFAGRTLIRVQGGPDLDFKYGYMNAAGEVVIPCQYELAGAFSGGVAPVANETYGWGFINEKGETVEYFRYLGLNETAYPFAKDGLAVVGNAQMQVGAIRVTPQAAPATIEGFRDVPENAFYTEAVLWGVENRLLNGNYGYFLPDIPARRCDVVEFMWYAAGAPDPWGSGQGQHRESPFKDVAPSESYYPAVCWAYRQGITGGTTADTFDPEGICTRAQVVTFLWRHFQKEQVNAPSRFSDVSPGAYYADAVAWAVEKGITQGTGGGAFSPNQTCTRAHILTFLYRAYR